jgi:protein SCO1/2
VNTTPNKPTSRKRYAIWLLAAVAVIAGVLANQVVYRKNAAPSDVTSTDLDSKALAAEKKQIKSVQENLLSTALFPSDFRSIPAFSLTDQQGQAVTESFFDGQWSMVFFGYTHCPDICPMTMSIMDNVVDELAKNNTQPLQVVFVSVDPKRDTSEKLGQYMAYFNEDFKGITGELADVLAMTSDLGIVASYTTIEGTSDYLVDHTASMLLVDPQGRIRAKFNAPHKAENIVNDFQKIVNEFS